MVSFPSVTNCIFRYHSGINARCRLLVCLLLLYILTACSSSPDIVLPVPDDTQPDEYTMYIVGHGWHTGIVIPALAIQNKLPQLKQRFPSAPFLEIGWGDQGFYQANEITSKLTLQAIFWPTESVVHVVAVPEEPYRYFSSSEVVKICLAKNRFDSLLQFLENSFYKTVDKNIDPTKHGIYGDSQFYTGEGDYYLMNTCNKWTAKALASSGFDIGTTFKLSSESVMGFLREENVAVVGPDESCLR